MTGDARGREYRRFTFVAGCVFALVLAATLLPAITVAFEQSPIESVFTPGSTGSGSGGSGDGSLGSLNPTSETTVGNLDGPTSKSLRSLGPSVHFRVESSEPAYWRTGAYGTFTGTSWEQSGDLRPVDGSLDPPPQSGATVSYRVELNRTARALPTVWRPRRVSLPSVLATERGGLRSERPLGPGRTYEGVGVRPPRDPGVLATAGTDYPEGVLERYTQLPAETPDRLAAFTDNLTADADSPYEAARRIESFLEANKSYSLDVSAPETDHVASTFVFEMDRGYCEYFATSMTAMLRTQGIPARYVVGYSTGQPTGERTYTVRGMNAHAWVEVYFPDVGWVRFDPTPGAARLAAEREALQERRPDAPDYEHSETGSPGESFTPGNASDVGGLPESGSDNVTATPDGPPVSGTPTTTTENRSTDNFTDGDFTSVTPPQPDLPTPNDTDPPDDPATNGTDPGSNQTAVTDGSYQISLSGPAIPGAEVTVRVERDGEPVGGARVLFDGDPVGVTGRDGTVTARVPFVEELSVTVVPPGSPVAAVAPPPDGRLFSLQSANATVERTVRTETDATLSVGGTVATNRSVLVTATIRETPVPNATVRLDGEVVGRTDEQGRLELRLPDEPGNATLSVSRDPVSGSRQLRLPALTLSVEPTLPLALPWTGVTATARLGEQPAAGVPVTLGGERVGTTDVDGEVTATLPLADRVRLAVGAYGQRAGATVAGLWANVALSAVGLVAVAGAFVWVGRRRDTSVLARLSALIDAAVDALLSRLIDAADLVLALAGALTDGVRRALAALVGLATGRLTLAEVRAGLAEWLADARTAAREATAATDGPTEHEVRLAWRRLLEAASVETPETRTPGEIATHAVEEDGLPADHVETLRDAFRAVEYGAFDPASWAGAVEDAIEGIEAAGESSGAIEADAGRTTAADGGEGGD